MAHGISQRSYIIDWTPRIYSDCDGDNKDDDPWDELAEKISIGTSFGGFFEDDDVVDDYTEYPYRDFIVSHNSLAQPPAYY